MVISSAKRFAILHELRDEPNRVLPTCWRKLAPVDLVLVEGFKREPFPSSKSIALVDGKPLLHPDDPPSSRSPADAPLPQARVAVIDLTTSRGIADVLSARGADRARRRRGPGWMAQLTDDCFAFSGPLLPIDDWSA